MTNLKGKRNTHFHACSDSYRWKISLQKYFYCNISKYSWRSKLTQLHFTVSFLFRALLTNDTYRSRLSLHQWMYIQDSTPERLLGPVQIQDSCTKIRLLAPDTLLFCIHSCESIRLLCRELLELATDIIIVHSVVIRCISVWHLAMTVLIKMVSVFLVSPKMQLQEVD